MNIDTMQVNIQSSEQYRIRAKRQAQETQQVQQAQQVQEQTRLQETDTYDKANPVGEEVEGVYSVARNDDGSVRVDYVQPGGTSDTTSKTESMTAKVEAAKTEDNEDDSIAKTGANPSGKADGAKSGGSAPSTATSSTSNDDDDDELENLKQQRDTIRQQLNRESDESVKAQLRVQLQSVEMQIALKSSGVEA